MGVASMRRLTDGGVHRHSDDKAAGYYVLFAVLLYIRTQIAVTGHENILIAGQPGPSSYFSFNL